MAKPDNRVRPPAGPGALANRQDLQGNQPIRIPTGLPYGAAGQMRQLEQAVPLPQTAPSGAPGSAAASPQGPPQPGAPEDPRAVLQAVSGHPTDFPNRPLAGASEQSVGDLLGAMASNPAASADVKALAELAQRMGV